MSYTRISLVCGKRPTQTSPSLSKPRRSTRSCSSLLLRHSNLRLFGRQSESRCLYRISPVIQHTARPQNGASDKLPAHGEEEASHAQDSCPAYLMSFVSYLSYRASADADCDSRWNVD